MKIKLLEYGWLYLLLVLSVAAPCMASSKYAPHSPVGIHVIADNGTHFPIYPVKQRFLKNEKRAYLEALNGENYSLQIRNYSDRRVGLVIAVDGRNIISGKQSTLKHSENMYILGPYETQTYSGWRTSTHDIHRFYFTDIEDSYAHAFGDDSAMGVIAVAVYEEKLPFFTKREKIINPNPQASSPSRSNDSTSSNESAGADQAEAGTGFGEHQTSHVRRVHFNPKRKAVMKSFYKYEWRETLCNKRFIECGSDYHERENRFWPRDDYEVGYAPYPPGHHR